MQLHSEAGQYINPDLEASLLVAIAEDPGLYWELRDYLPEDPSIAFTAYTHEWIALAHVIEAGEITQPLEDVKSLSDNLKIELSWTPKVDKDEWCHEKREIRR
jgi:hypothetical protein